VPIRLEEVERRADQARRDWEEGRATLVTPLYGVTAQVASDVATNDLRNAAGSEIIRTAQAAEEDALGIFGAGSPPSWAQWAVFDGGVDERTCPLCGLLIGTEVKVGTSEYYAYAPPLHIHCRHFYTYFERPSGAPAFKEPPRDIIEKHGHFVTHPERYAPLRVPVVPGEANFSPRRIRDPQTGEYTEHLRWVKQPDAPLSQGAQTLLTSLSEKSQVIPAEAFGAGGSRELQELSRAGYVNIVSTLGEPQTMRVTKGTVGEVEEFLRQTYAGAKVASIRQVGTLEVAPGMTVPQWDVVYAESNAKRVTLNRWGVLAASVAAEQE